MKYFVWVMAAVILLWMAMTANGQPESAKDFPPYKFAEIPDESGMYKMVYQGCEIFIAVGGSTGELSFKSYPRSVSVSTGRNCH